MLQDAEFPENVRQVENTIVGAIAHCGSGDVILPRHLPESLSRDTARLPYEVARDAALRGIDRIYLREALARHKGNQSAAADELGIDRKTFASRWKAQEELDA
jgi:transcriptional regulator with PAS, ATPase and Fis domain